MNMANDTTLINHPQRTMSFEEIADFVDRRDLYAIRRGNIPLSAQVRLRAFQSRQHYTDLFERISDTTIRLRNT